MQGGSIRRGRGERADGQANTPEGACGVCGDNQGLQEVKAKHAGRYRGDSGWV